MGHVYINKLKKCIVNMGPKDTYNECLWVSGGCPESVEVICKQVYTVCVLCETDGTFTVFSKGPLSEGG